MNTTIRGLSGCYGWALPGFQGRQLSVSAVAVAALFALSVSYFGGPTAKRASHQRIRLGCASAAHRVS